MNAPIHIKDLEDLQFDNSFTRELPADSDTSNERRQVLNACYSLVQPTHVKQPNLVAFSKEMAQELNLSPDTCKSDSVAQIFSGNILLPGMTPHATCYGGHQFGSWAGQLGDGRIINLGEVINQHGQRWALQLKGAGATQYSRAADGLAVLRSSVREFLCSEAMHHLGVPTTRALSLIQTGEEVIRDMFYDGHPKPEPGAIVCRAAQSFTRFGNFELFTSRKDFGTLKLLANYTIHNDFPDIDTRSQQMYIDWFEKICKKTAEMIVHWMRVGFVHGVMNTDNMSILGLTIDYGPYGWLENYDPDWTPNTTDATNRRYRFGNQPQIALWNLAKLAAALIPLVKEASPLEDALKNSYLHHFEQGWQSMVTQKLGLNTFDPLTDQDLNTELLKILPLVETDMTIFYRKLATVKANTITLHSTSDNELINPLLKAYYVPDQLTTEYKSRIGAWIRNYINRVNKDGMSDQERQSRMNAVNPKYVLRNYLAQLATDKAEQGDNSLITELLDLLRHPYDEQPEKNDFAKKRPDWARHRPGCSMLSCSS